MHPPGPPRQPELVLTPAEMARADAASAVPAAILMQAAGRAVARAARHFGPSRVLVLCGPGNNGGDGYVAARLLAQQGWPVLVATLAPPKPGSLAASVAAAWQGGLVPFTPAEAARAALVIDAVFGAGFRGELPGLVADTLHAAARVLAVDVPSGLDGASGQACGRVRAAEATITFARLKPGHLLLPGRALCGATLLADIGLPEDAVQAAGPQTWRNTPSLWRLPPLGALDHKYTRGHLTVLGGASMTGAARLAAAAARRAGAGMVSIAAADRADVYRTGEPGVIVTEAPLQELLHDARRQVWVCGPGLGQDAARAALPLLTASGRTVVADADALGAFGANPEALRGCALLTPHEGEFTRLFGPVGPSKLESARAAARRIGAVVLLKGADTVIAAPDGRAAINGNAPAFLATAGTGDVLAGIAGALLAQGMPAFEGACAAAWLHGHAGALAGPGMVAEDLVAHIAAARSGGGAA